VLDDDKPDSSDNDSLVEDCGDGDDEVALTPQARPVVENETSRNAAKGTIGSPTPLKW